MIKRGIPPEMSAYQYLGVRSRPTSEHNPIGKRDAPPSFGHDLLLPSEMITLLLIRDVFESDSENVQAPSDRSTQAP